MDDEILRWKISLKPKQRKRTYKHFDTQIDLNNSKHLKIVCETIKNLKTHQFLPFIKFIKKEIRYRKGKTQKAERSTKERPIMYASHIDAHLYSFYAYVWSKKYEEFLKQNKIVTNVLAYRKVSCGEDSDHGKNNINFANEVFESIQNMGDCIVIAADIQKFFDTLNHRVLKDQLCNVLGTTRLSPEEYKIFRSLTSYRYVLKESGKNNTYSKLILQIAEGTLKKGYSNVQSVYESGRDLIKNNKIPVGIPQGSPVSGLLANIYLSTFDYGFKEKFPHIIYRRYSDDIILVCPINEADTIYQFLLESIKVSKLVISPTKVFLTHFKKRMDGSVVCIDVKDGRRSLVRRRYLDYLGFEFNGQNVLLRGKTLQRAYKKGAAKVGDFYLRQTKDNPKKKHVNSPKPARSKKEDTYIKRSDQLMKGAGSNITSQEKKMHRFLLKKRKESKAR